MEALLAHCIESLSGYGSHFAAFFMAGLVGGFTHCFAMCGPFVACEQACAGASFCRSVKSGAIASLPYHAGRFTTYSLLGFFVAALAYQVASKPWWPYLSSLLLATAGCLFLFSCLKSCGHAAQTTRSPLLTYIRGTLLGFMPCGLLYAALMMAATLANPLRGMVAMGFFTIGTIPALVLVSGGTQLLSRKWQVGIPRAGRALMAFNGISLLVMAATVVR